jgi:hypothetical protein
MRAEVPLQMVETFVGSRSPPARRGLQEALDAAVVFPAGPASSC